MFFCSNRGLSGFDIYVSRPAPPPGGDRGETEVAPVEELNSRFDEREPGLTGDGRTLFFASDRAGDAGQFALYRSLEDNGTWLPPNRLAGLEVGYSQRGPQPTPDGFALYFESSELDEGGLRVERRATCSARARSSSSGSRPRRSDGSTCCCSSRSCAWPCSPGSPSAGNSSTSCTAVVLLSILIHLLLMWWFRHLHPEPEVHELGPGPDATFQVRMLSDRLSGGGLRERGGALEVARTDYTETEALERHQQELPDRELADAALAPAAGASDRARRGRGRTGAGSRDPRGRTDDLVGRRRSLPRRSCATASKDSSAWPRARPR